MTAAAGAGIGRGVAERLAAGGATVAVTDIHERRARETADALADAGFSAVAYRLDVGDRDEIERVVAAITKEHGPPQILVNNAAVNVIGSVFDYSVEHWDWTVAVNLSGPWHLCRAVMPLMRDAGGGAIVNVSSLAADVGGAGIEGPYAITKGGLNVLTRSCAHEGAPFGIRSNAVTMGVVEDTKFIKDHPEIAQEALPLVPLGRHVCVSDITETVAFLASPRSASITGEIVNVAAGYYMRN